MDINKSMSEFHYKLKSIIEDREYSIKDLSCHSGISLDTLNELIMGTKLPSTEDLMILSALLDISVNYMMSYTDQKERMSSLVLKNDIPLDMSQKSIEILRRIVALYMIIDEKSRENLLKYFLE